jgi:hypothetical protein
MVETTAAQAVLGLNHDARFYTKEVTSSILIVCRGAVGAEIKGVSVCFSGKITEKIIFRNVFSAGKKNCKS